MNISARFSGLLVLTLFSLLLGNTIFAQNEKKEEIPLVKFEGKAAFTLPAGGRNKQKYEQVAEEGKTAAKITWQIGAKSLVELVAVEQQSLLAFGKGITLNILFNNSGYPEARGFGLRVVDANEEIWQFGGLNLPDGAGWKVMKVDLASKKNLTNWGGSEAGRGTMDLPVRLLGMVINASDKNTEARSILLGAITRNDFNATDVEPEAALQPLKVTLETPTRVKVVEAGKESAASYRILNTDPKNEFKVRLVVEGTSLYGGKNDWKSELVTVPAGQSVQIPFGNKLGKFGWWKLAPSIESADGKARVAKPVIPVAYFQPAGTRPLPPKENFWFGIDARLRGTDYAWMVEACSLIGVDIFRTGVNWPDLEPQSGQWKWPTHVAQLETVQKAKMQVLHSFTFTPGWAAMPEYVEKLKKENKSGRIYTTPPREEALRAAVRTIVEKNKAYGVSHYDMWNEPDLSGFWSGSTKEYLQFMKTVYQEVKAADPKAIVLSGGIASLGGHGGHGLNPDLIERMIVGNQDYYDAISLHDHGTFRSFVAALDGPLASMRARLKKDKPLYFTETGTPMHGSMTAEKQASELVKKISFARARGAMGFIWFIFTGVGGDTGPFALVSASGNPLPTYCSYNELAKNLRNQRFDRQVNVGSGNWMLSFTDDVDSTLIAWNENASTANERVLVKLSDPVAFEVDVMGNKTPADVYEKIASLNLSGDVKYFQSKKGMEVLGALVALPEKPYGEPGKKIDLVAKLQNPLGRAAKFQLKWTNHDGVVKTDEISVEAGQKKDASLSIVMPVVKTGDKQPTVRLAYVLEGTPWTGELDLPLSVATLIPAGAISTRNPDFTLADSDHVFDSNKNDPNRIAYCWKGPQDLSAQVWLAVAGDALVMKVDVTDDVHKQPNQASMMWQADGIQMGITLPGIAGAWQIGLGRSDSGENLATAWKSPAGLNPEYAEKIELKTTPRNGGMVYEAKFPFKGSGMDAAILRARAIGFNLIVNDEDGGGREGFCFVADGLGTVEDSSKWPLLTFE